MKYLFYALTLALAFGAGCKKREDGSSELMTADEIADKTQEVAVQTSEKAAEVTQKAEEVTVQAAEKVEEVSRKASAAVSSLTVNTEEVMGDLNKSVGEIKQKVAAFDKTQLLAYVDQYKNVILEKKAELEKLTEQVKGLAVTEMISEKGKTLKAELTKYTGQLTALKDRYAVYLDKLKTMGVDLSAYGL